MIIPFEEYGVRIANEDDYSRVIDILAQSFRNDPQINWMLNAVDNPDRIEKAMKQLIEYCGENTVITITTEQDGVAIWESSKNEKFSFSMISMLYAFLVSAGVKSLIRSYEDKELSGDHRPDTDHYYLSMLAVHPDSQGKGVANRLLYPVLKSCRENGIPVYLETGNPKNVEIYKKKGFVLSDTVEMVNLTRFYMNTKV